MIGPIRCAETSIKDYHSTLRYTPEERRYHQHRGGSLKSEIPFVRWVWGSSDVRVCFEALQQTESSYPYREMKHVSSSIQPVTSSLHWLIYAGCLVQSYQYKQWGLVNTWSLIYIRLCSCVHSKALSECNTKGCRLFQAYAQETY
jgi:hypothetical protein